MPCSICAQHGPSDDTPPYFNYQITIPQRGSDQALQRTAFWESRYTDSCDPFAPSALGVVQERGMGKVTMKWLRAVAQARNLQIDEQQLGIEIMHAHVSATDGDSFGIPHLLSRRQITDYHVAVFKSHGLPDYTFGGAPFGGGVGGKMSEWLPATAIWCVDCDKVP